MQSVTFWTICFAQTINQWWKIAEAWHPVSQIIIFVWHRKQMPLIVWYKTRYFKTKNISNLHLFQNQLLYNLVQITMPSSTLHRNYRHRQYIKKILKKPKNYNFCFNHRQLVVICIHPIQLVVLGLDAPQPVTIFNQTCYGLIYF